MNVNGLLRDAMEVLTVTAGPVMLAMLAVGLVVGVFQAATQINDPAVGFLPRFVAALLVLWLAGPWVVERMAAFVTTSLTLMPTVAR